MNSFSFPPIANSDAKILILGTMPGKTSLEINEYYGYKYNVFWKILFIIFNKKYSEDYKIKKNLIKINKIALWDSLKYCVRKGSLDSNIRNEKANNFKDFFTQHPDIKHIIFNGKASFSYYKKYIGLSNNFEYYSLPSTSPANARKNFEEKLKEWRIIYKLINTETNLKNAPKKRQREI